MIPRGLWRAKRLPELDLLADRQLPDGHATQHDRVTRDREDEARTAECQTAADDRSQLNVTVEQLCHLGELYRLDQGGHRSVVTPRLLVELEVHLLVMSVAQPLDQRADEISECRPCTRGEPNELSDELVHRLPERRGLERELNFGIHGVHPLMGSGDNGIRQGRPVHTSHQSHRLGVTIIYNNIKI